MKKGFATTGKAGPKGFNKPGITNPQLKTAKAIGTLTIFLYFLFF